MKSQHIRALFVEDNIGDARLITELLLDASNDDHTVDVTRAGTLAAAQEELRNDKFDVALLDLNLPDSMGLETYTTIQDQAPSLPVIVLTGFADETFATIAVHQGAQDYLVKGQIDYRLLIRSILYAIERKQSESKLRRLNEQLEQRVAERTAELSEFVRQLEQEIAIRKAAERHKDDFVSMISHELRTPLSIAKEAVNLVLDGVPGKLNDQQQHILQISKRNIDRLTRMINNLLNLSRIETGRLVLKRRPVDLCMLVTDVLSSYELTAAEKGVKLETCFSQRPIDISVDPDCIAEIISNLVGNALKFTERGYIRISVEEGLDDVECAVADTGIGIPEKDLERIFDKFEQAHRDYRTSESGTGLGLAIARHIVELHGGKIWVDSEVDKGSIFTFTLSKRAPRETLIRQGT